MILLRHGQSEFNLHFTRTRVDPGIPDPALTEAGVAQAREAGQALRGAGVRRIIASPYRRTLQTAALVAEALNLPVTVDATVRERYGFTCDIGSPVSTLRQEWPRHDFDHLAEVWWPAEEEPVPSILARAAEFRATMAAAPDWREVLVVSHWGFILSLTGQSVPNGSLTRVDVHAPAPEQIVWRHH